MTAHAPPPGERPTALLYDWDNTLVDGWAAVTAALNAVFAAFAMPAWTAEDTRSRARLSLRESFPTMFGDRLGTRARPVLRHLPQTNTWTTCGRCRARPRRWWPGRRGRRAWCPTRRATSCAPKSPISAGRRISAPSWAPATPPPTSRTRRRFTSRCTTLGLRADASVWYLGDTALDMQTARAAGVTAVLIGDAGHDGGIAHAAPDIHFPSAHDLAAHFRALA